MVVLARTDTSTTQKPLVAYNCALRLGEPKQRERERVCALMVQLATEPGERERSDASGRGVMRERVANAGATRSCRVSFSFQRGG